VEPASGRARPYGDKQPTRPPVRPGRPARKGRKDPLWTKLVIIFGAVVLVGSAATVVVPKLAARWALSDVVQRNDIPDELRGDNIDGAINFLLLGSDTRDEGNLSSIANADSIVLLHIPASHDTAYMISLPRDLRVTIPRRNSAPTDCDGGTDKLNAAFGYGAVDSDGNRDTSAAGRSNGVILTMRTISCIIGGGLKFNGWATVNFDGFDAVVQALGSVYLCVDTDVWSIHYRADGTPADFYYRSGPSTRPQRKHYAEGECRDFLPWEALDYSRQRVDLGDGSGDYGRQRHQQQLLQAIIRKIASTNPITNFNTIAGIQQAAGDLLVLDLSGTAVEDWVLTMRDLRPDDLVMIKTYGGQYNSVNIDGTSYERLDQDLIDLLNAAKNDTIFDFLVAHPDWVGQSNDPATSVTPTTGATG
jgi:anionic cell wall polymer biosynthesis LytR-Cps2A-Psr (LCP) family protein